MMQRLLCGLLLIGVTALRAEDPLPPPPREYVTDSAGVIPRGEIVQLNRRLNAFERETSNQIVAAVFPSLPEGASLEDFAQRLYSSWKPGTKKNANGVLILVFVKERKVRIQSGYGLEGALPDALCSRIIRETMVPAFRDGNFGSGLAAGVQAVMQATKSEYKGKAGARGRTMSLKDLLFSPLGLFFLVMIALIVAGRNRRDASSGGISPGAAAATGFFLGSSGGWGAGGGGDSGGFSGGGGESGGGGASGEW
jgi:uncharacterized protein